MRWIFRPVPADGGVSGGLASAEVLPTTVDTFVREVLQNCRDQRAGPEAVRVRITLHELSRASVDSFLESVGWGQLEPHIKGAADPANVTIAARLRQGLERAQGSSFRVLIIEDSFTNGLWGEEKGRNGNFAHLVRNELTTPASRRDSGGSFGLGKSVLWRYSSLSTVLFYSRLGGEDPATHGRTRFIGRTLLPSHAAFSDEWEGPGWFGREAGLGPDDSFAESAWDADADEIAAETLLERHDDLMGTSIAILGFDDPTREEEPDTRRLCDEIADSAERWFWPALSRGDMTVQVSGYLNGDCIASRDVTAGAANFENVLRTFTAARNGEADPDVTLRDIPLDVPDSSGVDGGGIVQGVTGHATLGVLVSDSIDSDATGLAEVATQRGAGMVVEYFEPRIAKQGTTGFVSVLLAGTARGLTAEDIAVEEFLRAAEPPAHDKWVGTTGRVHQEYARGSQAALARFFTAIDQELRAILNDREFSSDDGPTALKKLFPMPASGTSEHTEVFRLDKVSQSFSDGVWSFEGEFKRKPKSPVGPWKFSAEVAIGRDGRGARSRLVPLALVVDGGAAALDHAVTTPERPVVRVPEDIASVRFVITTNSLSDMGISTDAASQVSVRLKLKGSGDPG
jgi:hypothetical protein